MDHEKDLDRLKLLIPKCSSIISYDHWLFTHNKRLCYLYDRVKDRIGDAPLLDQGEHIFDDFCKFMYKRSSGRSAYDLEI